MNFDQCNNYFRGAYRYHHATCVRQTSKYIALKSANNSYIDIIRNI